MSAVAQAEARAGEVATVRAAVAEAALHARAGRYDTARRLLDTLDGRDSDTVEVLDLLARVHAQRGDLAEADACWARVEHLDPEHAGARDGRRRIRETWAGKRSGGGLVVGAAAACLLLVGGGAVAGWAWAPGPTADERADPAVAQELTRLRHEMGELRVLAPSDEAPSDQPAANGATSGDRAALRDVRDALGDPRWTTTLDPRSVVVTFRDPVFLAGGAQTSGSGADLLGGLGDRLGGLADVEVTVVGHTSDTAPVPGSRYAGNAEVSLARALAAAQVISSGSGIPLSAVDVASAGDVDPPYPNTNATNRARNQTVTVAVEVVP
ncbi:type VI secretion system protein ImpK [Promicromonospora umidemergens]|uniref:OmpA-like domain-containing protein n=1 Tax=Promicromonospora umidemergens TaxID=629679 RepID=A0ABP8X984_9MICO|nr:OmpA family protein [Promicromonospora umidemergens]MCP2281568.1 type VI secretion system protein ImpK [Promicromonospora umidemergens]